MWTPKYTELIALAVRTGKAIPRKYPKNVIHQRKLFKISRKCVSPMNAIIVSDSPLMPSFLKMSFVHSIIPMP